MAIKAPEQGFFTTDGALKADSLTSSGWQAAAKTTASGTNSGSVAEQAASTTASAITDAAVVRVSTQMNVGKTGFDTGVSDMVGEAVSSALNKLGTGSAGRAASGSGIARLEIAGTYQDEIMAAARKTTNPVTPPADNSKGKSEEAKTHGNKHVSYQDEAIAASKKAIEDAKSAGTQAPGLEKKHETVA